MVNAGPAVQGTRARAWMGWMGAVAAALVVASVVAAVVLLPSGRSASLRVGGSRAAVSPSEPLPEKPLPGRLAAVDSPDTAPPVAAATSERVTFEPLSANIMNDFSRRAEQQWRAERRAPEAAEREQHVKDLFAGADSSTLLRSVDCRTTMCRMDIELTAETLQRSKSLTGHLGQSVAVLENDGTHMVVLVPADELSAE